METRIRIGGNTRVRLRDKLAQEHEISDNDLYSMEVDKNRILLTKLDNIDEE